ncbi:MAG: winged helix-turn-helix transcriptional regulator [Deltaproteobacteria bacterium]|nr:winged helix-turn-helix transcriptional regulator [Deltaproteobacteria bacterium]
MVEPLEGQMFLFRGGVHDPRPEGDEEAPPVEAPDSDLPEGTGAVLPPPQRTIPRATRPRQPRPVEPENATLFPVENSTPRPRPELPFSRRMSDLVRRLQLLERDALASLELTLPQAHALHALRGAGSLRMQELAASLGLAQSTVTRLVAPLKRMGLLDRRPDRKDGRATRAFLTEKGTATSDGVEAADRQLYQGILEHLPDSRRAEVVAAIELLHDAVLAIAEDAEGDA